MRAGLFYFYGLKNSGDMAINLGAVELLKNGEFDEIMMLSRFDKNSKNFTISKDFVEKYSSFFENTQLLPGPFEFERKENKKDLFKEYLKIGFKMGDIKKTNLNNFIKSSDVIFFNGGNMLRINSLSDFLRMIALFIPVFIAKSKNKRVVLLPHSSNYMNKYQSWLASKFMKQFDYVYSREDYSYEIFKKMGLKNCKSQIDMCFFKSVDSLKKRKSSNNVKTIALTVRKSGIGDIGELSFNKINELNFYLKQLLNAFDEKEINILVVNQTKKDSGFSNEIFKNLSEKYSVTLIEEYDTFKLSEIYSKVDLVIGMRLHSLILAASVGTPIVGLFSNEWGIKNKGTLEMLGLKSVTIEEYSGDIGGIVNYNINFFDESKEFILKKYNELISDLALLTTKNTPNS